MFEVIKRLFKHSFVYALGNSIQSLAGLVLIPLYTKTLPAAEFGKLEILNTFLLILNNLLSLGLASALLKCSERDVKSDAEKKSLTSTALLATLVFGSLSTLGLFLLSPYFTSFLKIDSAYYVYLILATNVIAITANLGFSILRSKEKSVRYTLITLVRFFVLLFANSFFILALKWGIIGILLGNLISQIAILSLLLPTFFQNINFQFSRRHFKNLINFGLAIIPSGLFMWVMDLSDRYFLNYFHGSAEVGYYSLAYKFGLIILIALVGPFQLAWPTVSFSLAKNNNARQIYAKILSYFTLISSLIAVFLVIFAEKIILFVSKPEYLKAVNLVGLIAFAYVFLGMHYIVVVGLHLKNKSGFYPILIVIPGIINLILNYLLIPSYGTLGAGLATFISFLVLIILTVILVGFYFPFHYETKRLLKILLIILIVLAVHFFYAQNNNLSSSLINLGLLPLSLLLLLFTKFFTPVEVSYFKKIPFWIKNFTARKKLIFEKNK